jgi:hypothetical protein
MALGPGFELRSARVGVDGRIDELGLWKRCRLTTVK